MDNLPDLSREEKVEQLKKLGSLLTDSLKNGEERVSLATSTYDTVRDLFLLRKLSLKNNS